MNKASSLIFRTSALTLLRSHKATNDSGVSHPAMSGQLYFISIFRSNSL